ncbi:MAG: sigma-70 family RNA polymerase sigma factor [Galactobacillus timonensis]|uniref:sigma-70 family RNA polymerase sigma factor n=2 Tax=Galactobacillus timonensis TaxID=2041840 RepID=UPI00240A423C|nr:sigma-70 family RNA polymerase sigma factor [Galactobacillus timonensis]MDD6599447.1 sigma-70 family RNA polymerase sigma factor [Galactobacillus timonensis]
MRDGNKIDLYADLVVRAQKGDQEAFEKLVKEIRPLVRHWEYKYLHSPDDLQEVEQKVCIDVYRHLGSLENPRSFLKWLETITQRESLAFLKSAYKQHLIDFTSLSRPDGDGNECDYDPADENLSYLSQADLDAGTKSAILKGFLDALPDNQRICVSLFFFDEMSIKDIAAEEGLSEGTVKSNIRYAKAKIKIQVEEFSKKYDIKLYGVSPFGILSYFYYAEEAQILYGSSDRRSASPVSEWFRNNAVNLTAKAASPEAASSASNVVEKAVASSAGIATVISVVTTGGGAAAVNSSILAKAALVSTVVFAASSDGPAAISSAAGTLETSLPVLSEHISYSAINADSISGFYPRCGTFEELSLSREDAEHTVLLTTTSEASVGSSAAKEETVYSPEKDMALAAKAQEQKQSTKEEVMTVLAAVVPSSEPVPEWTPEPSSVWTPEPEPAWTPDSSAVQAAANAAEEAQQQKQTAVSAAEAARQAAADAEAAAQAKAEAEAKAAADELARAEAEAAAKAEAEAAQAAAEAQQKAYEEARAAAEAQQAAEEAAQAAKNQEIEAMRKRICENSGGTYEHGACAYQLDDIEIISPDNSDESKETSDDADSSSGTETSETTAGEAAEETFDEIVKETDTEASAGPDGD